MQSYRNLQNIYQLDEIKAHCVDIDFGYAFICAMASSEVELQQWMPMLFINESVSFSNEKIASDFAQLVLAIYQQALEKFQQDKPLTLLLEESPSTPSIAAKNFANGYLQGLLLIDNLQPLSLPDDSSTAQLQQTCLLLLDKLATDNTNDLQKLAIFEQLPSEDEIISLLPILLASYGHQCLAVNH